MAKTRHSGRMFGQKTARKRQKRGSDDQYWPTQAIMSNTQNTPRLAQNAPFAHLSAPRGCQSVVLYVHMAKTRHSGRMFGRKKRPEKDRTATEFGLARPNVKQSKTLVLVLLSTAVYTRVECQYSSRSMQLYRVHPVQLRMNARMFCPNRDRI
jgi:hypothetical protein